MSRVATPDAAPGEPAAPEGPTRALILLFAAVSALGPFTMQIFVPALPMVQREFDVSTGSAQLTFSVFVFVLGPSLLLYGPLSDRFGRRPVLVAGLVVFTLGTLLCWLAPTLGVLVAGRALQAMGSAAGLVITRALMSDLYGPRGMAAALSYTTMAMVVPPMLAPIIGGMLVDTLGWRWIFAVMLAAAAATLVFCVRYLPEPPVPASRRQLGVVEKFRRVLSRPRFHLFTLQAMLIAGMFYGFMAGSPYLMVNVLDRPATEFGLYFLFLAAGYIVGNYLSGRLSGRIGLDRMILIGAALALSVAWIPVLFTAVGWWVPLAFFAPMALLTVANGMAMPSAQTGAISAVPEASGTASSSTGFMQQAAGACIVQLLGWWQNDTPWPMVTVIFGCAFAAMIASVVLSRWPADRPASPPA